MWVYRGVEYLCRLLTSEYKSKYYPQLKLVSFVETLAGYDFSKRGMQTEAHCRKKPQSPAEELDAYLIAVQGFFVGVILC